ncbi:MAG: fatty acid desaturase [Alphaproteobacteria bacterium]|nr:fatty acid desaturase [Alphaproteobacteria bacterium]
MVKLLFQGRAGRFPGIGAGRLEETSPCLRPLAFEITRFPGTTGPANSELMKRCDGPALRNYGLWLTLVIATGLLAFFSYGGWLALPAFLVFGTFYASGAESRFHECLHGTPFKSRRLNECFLHLTGFMSLKNGYLWRWSHARHHTDTIVVGRDPEIAYPRPPDISGMVLNLLHLRAGTNELKRTLRISVGRLSEDEKDYVPETERPKVILVARIYLAVLVGAVFLAILAGSWLPVLLIGLPTFYGSWLHSALSAMQHAGLAEDAPDHRLNSRTVHLNPVFHFIYANMNYHVEHHMFPMVPFHGLPDLHEEIKTDCPPAYDGMIAAYREMIPALKKQLSDPTHFVRRTLPIDAGRMAGPPDAAAAAVAAE